MPYKYLVLYFVCSVGPCYWPHSSLSGEEVVYYLLCDVLGVGVVYAGVLSNVLIVVVLPFELWVVVGVACSVVLGSGYLLGGDHCDPLDC